MTLMKSLLLGSAATLVAVASAQAADLPTRKGAPAAEYVKVCKIGGIAGFIIPGSDTCLKIGGLVTVQFGFGNVGDQLAPGVNNFVGGNFSGFGKTQLASGTALSKYQPDIGFFARGELDLDAVSNTAYGPLHSRIGLQSNYGNGYQSTSPLGSTVLNEAWIQWAGLTVGKHESFYDFIGGGPPWDSTISPNHGSSNPRLEFAYTATFGGGFSATLAAEEPYPAPPDQANSVGFSFFPFPPHFTGTGVIGVPGTTTLGERSPDIVGSLDVVQGWGKAHLAAVAHNVRLESAGFSGTVDSDVWGYGVIGGVQFNLTSMGANDNIALQGSWTHDAMAYSGLTGAGVNNNNQGGLFILSDEYFNPFANGGAGAWAVPTAWDAAAVLTYYISPQFEIRPLITYGEVDYGSNASFDLSQKLTSWLGGGVIDWIPVTNLDFSLDLLYQTVHQSSPVFAVSSPGGINFKNDYNDFSGRLRIERDF
jgi:hypothetical protein